MKGLFYMYKKIALILALLLTLTACSGNAATLMDFIGEGATVLDFEGMTFRIFHTGGEDLRYVDKEANASSLRHEKLIMVIEKRNRAIRHYFDTKS